MNMSEIIDNKLGKAFSPTAVIAGYVILGLGVLFLLGNIFIGIGLIAAACFVCFTGTGVQIDIKDKKYKEYTIIYFINNGKWKPFGEFVNLAILTTRQSYTTYSGSNRSMTSTDKYFDIFLLNKSHRQKLRVGRHKKRESAMESAKELAAKLGIPFVEYSPEISERTRARR